jgi:hypothetical protein
MLTIEGDGSSQEDFRRWSKLRNLNLSGQIKNTQAVCLSYGHIKSQGVNNSTEILIRRTL